MAESWGAELSVGGGCSANEWKDSCELLGRTNDSRRSVIAADEEQDGIHQHQEEKKNGKETTSKTFKIKPTFSV